MKILFISHYTELFGANRSLLALLAYLKNQPDVEVSVLLPRKGVMHTRLTDMNITTHIVPFRYSHIPKKSGVFKKILKRITFYAEVQKLKRHFSQHQFDLVHTNSSVIAHGLFLARDLSAKHVWHIREFGEQDYRLTPIWGMKVLRRLFRKSDALIFVSQSLKKHFINWSSESSFTPVIYNGVFHFDAPFELKSTHFPGKEIHICFAGLMSSEKNALEALSLISLLNDNNINARLVVCARMEGEYAELFKKTAADLTLQDHITYKGFVDDLAEELNTCHFLIMPSRFEGMGRVTAEAMAQGVPVIGYQSSGTSELFEDGKSGIYYRELDEILQKLQKISSSEYQSMCLQAREKALADFTIENYGASVLKLYQRIVHTNLRHE